MTDLKTSKASNQTCQNLQFPKLTPGPDGLVGKDLAAALKSFIGVKPSSYSPVVDVFKNLLVQNRDLVSYVFRLIVLYVFLQKVYSIFWN
jgi:hypothetical protein